MKSFDEWNNELIQTLRVANEEDDAPLDEPIELSLSLAELRRIHAEMKKRSLFSPDGDVEMVTEWMQEYASDGDEECEDEECEDEVESLGAMAERITCKREYPLTFLDQIRRHQATWAASLECGQPIERLPTPGRELRLRNNAMTATEVMERRQRVQSAAASRPACCFRCSGAGDVAHAVGKDGFSYAMYTCPTCGGRGYLED